MTLGTTMRDAREAARMSIAALSEATSIRIGLLTEMESDNFKHCGGDIYARGHLRNLAVLIGLDPQILLDLYNDQHAVESQRIQDSLVDNNIIQVPREKKSLSWKVPAIISVCILAVIAVVQLVVSNQSSTPTVSPVVAASTSATATPAATVSAVATPQTTIATTQGPVTLVVSASRGNSYIDIIVDGKDVEKSSIFQGEKKSYRGLKTVSVYFSNPAALDVTYNGKLLPPLGGENQEVRRTFR
jgi:cytoskeletal protein RodZ